MTQPALSFGTRIVQYLGKALDGPRHLGRYVVIGTLSVAQTLLNLMNAGVIKDVARIKEALIQKTEAETAIKLAEADLKVAEAAEAANRVTLNKRPDAIAQAERQLKAQAAKTEAEAEAISMDAGTRRIEGVANAQARLLEAIGKLRAEGGEIFFSKENLREMLRLQPPRQEDEEKTPRIKARRCFVLSA
jgi:hypothetical protein